jgi:transcriptional repressor NrdR
MQCVRCGSDKLSVVDSRADGDAIRRRRECQQCGFRFTTYERPELALPMIIKKDDRRQPFDRNKIRAGLLRACEKRPVSMEAIDATVDAIERKVAETLVKELDSKIVGEMVVEALRDLDKIAYVRFASVYREFSDVKQFKETLKEIS